MHKFIKISILALGLIGIYSTPFVEASSEGKKIVLDEKEDKKEEETQPLKASSLFLGCFDDPDNSLDNLRDATINDCVFNTIDKNKRQDYEKLASFGNPYGMLALGHLYAKEIANLLEKKENPGNAEKIIALSHEAAQWYLLAFESHWLTTKGKSFKSAVQGLEELSKALQKEYDGIYKIRNGVLKIIKNIKSFYVDVIYKDFNNLFFSIAKKYEESSQFNMLNDNERLQKYYMFLSYAIDIDGVGDMLNTSENAIKRIDPSLRYKKIKQCYEKSGKPCALYNLGALYYNRHLVCEYPYEEAKKCWERSKTSDAFESLGNLYNDSHIQCNTDKERYEKAKEYYEKSGTPEALGSLGMIYYNERNYKKAKEYWEKSGIPEALCALGVICYNEGNYKKAKEYWEKSRIPEALCGLGVIFYNKKNYEKSKQYYEQSKTPQALHNLGVLYINGCIENSLSPLERYKIALKYFQDALIEGCQQALEAEQKCQELIGDEQEVNNQEKNLNSEDNNEDKKSSSDDEKGNQEKKIEIKHETTDIKEEKKEEKVLEPKKKKTKEEIQEEKKQKKLLAFEQAKIKRDKTLEKMKEKFSLDKKPISSGINDSKPMRITFIDENMREKFLEVRRSESMGDKLQELIDDIKKCPWGLQGAGDSEVLKNDRSGQFSRRINLNDRLIYIPTKEGIEILECQGHYE
jgi:toxin YoeB